MLEALDKTFVLYNNAGFEIKEFFADPEFECVRDELENPENGIIVNIGAAGEHEPNIERCHRVIKERYRAVYHSCPFSMWPKIMVIRGASEVVKWLNTFPPAGGVSAQYSPRAIIMGRPVEYEKNCKVKFGSYVEAYNENKPTNTPKERTISGIFLRSLDNRQGGYEVLDLQTGQTTTRFKVTELNMPVEVIKRVEQLADKDGFKPHSTPIVRTYALIPGVNDDDSDDDSDSESDTDSFPDLVDRDSDSDSEDEDSLYGEEEVAELENRGNYTTGVHSNRNIAGVPGEEQQQLDEEQQQLDDQSMESDEEQDELQDKAEDAEEQSVEEDAEDAEPEETTAETVEEEPTVGDPEMDDEPTPEPLRRSTRVSRQPVITVPTMEGQRHFEVQHLMTQGKPEETIEYSTEETEVLAMIFAQVYSLSKGL